MVKQKEKEVTGEECFHYNSQMTLKPTQKIRRRNKNTRLQELYNEGKISLSKELQNAFHSISDAFEYWDFSFIDITQERISFGGLGAKMYVHSRNGKIPRYHYSKDDGLHPDIYTLGNSWYLLEINLL